MGSSYYANPIIFLVETIFGLYILAVMLRFLLQWCNADFYNPISQFLVKITHPPLKILRRIIPSIGRIDSASIVLLILLQIVCGFLVFSLKGVSISPEGLFVWSLMQLLSLLINVFVFAILIQVILSWINPGSYNAASALIYYLTEPVLGTVRQMIPAIGGIDFSPIIVLVLLQLVKLIVFPPMDQLILMLS